jgi:hypothetical protein
MRNQPRTNTPLLETARSQSEQRGFRSPKEVEEEADRERHAQAMIAAGIDFMIEVGQREERKFTQRVLERNKDAER